MPCKDCERDLCVSRIAVTDTTSHTTAYYCLPCARFRFSPYLGETAMERVIFCGESAYFGHRRFEKVYG